MSTEPAARFSLRDLPVPAKVVVTCFLLAVGGGYSAAMVQLHMQDAKSGTAMPSVHDVILKYTGKKWFETDPPKPVSKFVKLLTTPPGAPFNGSGTMAPAFTTRDGGEWTKTIRENPKLQDELQQKRDGERDALVLWAESDPDVRKKAYQDDHFDIKAGKEPKAITEDFKIGTGAVKVRSIIETRCVRCHQPNGDDTNAGNFPLQTYEQIEKYLTVSAIVSVPPGGAWVRVQEPIGLEKLTQSTHAHLLSFSVLFSLTGLVFAFTSYPTVLRCVLGPWVLLAMVADISLWWLARLCNDWGQYFAMGIIGTGGVAGVGLALQITLSLFNMYGPKGKIVVLGLLALGAAGVGLVYLNKIEPGLKDKKDRLNAAKVDDSGKKSDESKKNGNGGAANGPPTKLSPFQNVLAFPVKGPDGKEFPVLEIPFPKGKDAGGMVRAFFDKDIGDFAAAVKDKDMAAQQKLMPERHGELAALVAWSKLADAERKKAYDADAFTLPTDLAKKPITPDYLKDGKAKVKSIITDRCIRCHADDENVTFNDYETLLKYLK
jgi:cytochrome c553